MCPRRYGAGAAGNAIPREPRHIGTLNGTFAVVDVIDAVSFAAVAPLRSVETEDTTIADPGVRVAARQIKIGSLRRASLTGKYNRPPE